MGDTRAAYFSEGVSDEVRGKLAALHGLEVIARTISVQYRSTTKTPKQVGQELHVRYLLTGTVRWDEQANGKRRVRVSPELIEAESGATKWQESFEASLTDVFRVQAEIATNVAQALRVRLTPSMERSLARRPTNDLDAYDQYVRGLEILDGTGDPTGQNARAAFAQAVRLDSAFALAWAYLAWAEGRDLLEQPRAAESRNNAPRR